MAAEVEQILSHWCHLTEGLQGSAMQFYAAIEDGLKRRDLPKLNVSRVDYREGGILSARREYLRVRCREHIFDVCAAPYGNGFFVSWWLGTTQSSLLVRLLGLIPIIGNLLMRAFVRPITYYQLDTALMFQESVRLAVLETLDGLTSAKGLRTLSETERQPIMHQLFSR